MSQLSHAQPVWCAVHGQWECPAPRNEGRHVTEWTCGCQTEGED